MKRTTTKRTAQASHKKTVKDLDVRPAKGGTVRGGTVSFQKKPTSGAQGGWDLTANKEA